MKKLFQLLLSLGLVLSYLSFSDSVLASTLYLAPGSGSVGQGKTISVQVRLNSGGEAVNAVSAYLAYPQDKLEVTGISESGSAFGIAAESVFGGGMVKISRGSASNISGNVKVATITFKGKSLGAANVAFIGGSAAPRAADSSESLNLGGSSGGHYTVVEPTALPISGDITLEIIDLKVGSVATDSAVVTWKTKTAADSNLEYGLEKDKYLLTVSESKLVTSHSLTISNPSFPPGTRIHFRVKSADGTGNTGISEDAVVQLKGYEVKIRVVDKSDNPLVGATVELYSEPTSATTDGNGEVSFTDISPGKHLVVVKSGPTEKTEEINIIASSSVQSFDIKIGAVGGESVWIGLLANLVKVDPRLAGGVGGLLLLFVIVVVLIKKRNGNGTLKNAEEVFQPEPVTSQPVVYPVIARPGGSSTLPQLPLPQPLPSQQWPPTVSTAHPVNSSLPDAQSAVVPAPTNLSNYGFGAATTLATPDPNPQAFSFTPPPAEGPASLSLQRGEPADPTKL